MADFRQVADQWIKDRLQGEEGKEFDAKYFVKESRTQLLYLVFFTGELISVAKGIRFSSVS
jgi:hypothetical protein